MNDEQFDPPWLTYSEAGERLGLSADAVRVRATRGKWRRMRGNDGRTLVQVPADPSELYPARPFARGGAIAALQEAVAALREQLQAERTRSAEQTAAERTERDRLYGTLAAAENRARAATEAVREAEAAARIATDALKAARHAEEARKARGRWTRIRAAWRGD
jgi:hypothetical protein